ncbi:MAG: Eco57I restriction-modification methylase domain-containing protein [Chloroflexota bacterium]|nr:Eco57I restriction-modification methylase domain-containing protein [Chloroflexota bacterium]
MVYTKPWVVELLLDLAGYHVEDDLGGKVAVEPAAGDGSFLLPMVERLVASCRQHGRSVTECEDALLAFELSPGAADRCRTLVHAALVRHGVSLDDATSLAARWVRTGDYLLEAPGLPAADYVIGNPPYIRLEEMEPETAASYRGRYRTMVGRADVYVAFFEAALKQLRPDAVCTFICADRWMLNQYGAELRRLVTSGFAVETIIELHRADAFEDVVSAYPAITVIRRAPQRSVVVARAERGVEQLGSVGIRAVLANDGQGRAGTRRQAGLTAARVESWFEGASPWPCSSPERLALLKRLEAEFYPLESMGTGTRVSIGVATGADAVFLTTDPELVESSRLLPLAMAHDLTSGHLQWSGRYLVNPWDGQGLVDLAKYPRLKGYLEEHEARLRGRHVGKKSETGWFRTIDRVDHGLTGKTKLYIADIKDRLLPVIDHGQTYPHHNLYFVQSAGWDHEVLGGLLLSDVAQLFVECYGVRMRGGYLRFQAQYLRRIRVPRPQDVSPSEAEALRRAFQERDREAATKTALKLYGIDELPQEAS